MSSSSVRAAIVGALVALAASADAQSTAEYRRHVDSLAGEWRTARALEARQDSVRTRRSLGDSIQVGSIIVYADSQWSALGRATAERLSVVVARAYGRLGSAMARHPFVLRDYGGPKQGTAVVSGIADPDGIV